MKLQSILQKMIKNRIRLNISGKADTKKAATKFGGMPDTPDDFEWPYYNGASYDQKENEKKNRPLSFLLQINCADLAEFDIDNMLPKKGVLSFFYEEASAKWGFDQDDRGCAKVYWFEDINMLHPCKLPDDLEDDYKMPEIGITVKKETCYPSVQDISLKYTLTDDQYDEYDEIIEDDNTCHQLLGWSGNIQGNMTTQCELINRGYYLGDGWNDIPKEDLEEAEKISLDKWQLLLQLDEVDYDDFYLSFGDCGRLYFYITNEDLKNCDFDNVWLCYQCF